MAIGLLYGLSIVWKKYNEERQKTDAIQEARVKDSKEREDKLFVALQITTDELQAVRITMDKKHAKNES